MALHELSDARLALWVPTYRRLVEEERRAGTDPEVVAYLAQWADALEREAARRAALAATQQRGRQRQQTPLT